MPKQKPYYPGYPKIEQAAIIIVRTSVTRLSAREPAPAYDI